MKIDENMRFRADEFDDVGNCKYLRFVNRHSIWTCDRDLSQGTTKCPHLFACEECEYYDTHTPKDLKKEDIEKEGIVMCEYFISYIFGDGRSLGHANSLCKLDFKISSIEDYEKLNCLVKELNPSHKNIVITNFIQLK